MAGYDLSSLDPRRFSTLLENRERAILSAEEGSKDSQPEVNKLAAALHPKFQHLEVTTVIEHGPDTKSFVCKPCLEMGSEALAYFSAGQYLSVSVDIDGITYSRPYSISSSPKDSLNGEYRLTVKRAAGGRVSNYILDNFKVGSKFLSSDPRGNFTYERLRDAKSVIALAGGSGITPFISMAKAIAQEDEDFELTILYGCRTREDIIFKEELEALENATQKLRVVYVLSEEQADGYEHGYITSELINKYKKSDTFSVFICGPSAMSEYLGTELEKLKLPRKFIRYELRGERFMQGGEKESVTVTVRAQNGVKKVIGRKDESILRILEKAKIAPPSSCRSGECGFCRSRLISGDVYITEDSDRRRMADKKFGYIHPCCSYALGDIEIEVSAQIQSEDA